MTKPVSSRMICNVAGCGSRVRSRNAQLCEKHYYRLRRTGTTDRIVRAARRRLDAHGYVWIYVPGHPATKRGMSQALEHRVVMYDAHGNGPYICHWCGAALAWDDMDIDHIDEDKQNNALSNLVPACPICNRKRGLPKQIEGQRRAAPQYTYEGQTLSAVEWAKALGISRSAFKTRLKRWPRHLAFTEPRGKFGPQARHV